MCAITTLLRHIIPLATLSLALLCLAAPAAAESSKSDPPGPSLEVMAGQMLMAGFRGLSLEDSPELERDLTQYHLGGVILFDRDVALGSNTRNIASPGQVRALTARIKASGIHPALVAVDQEGGRVQRLKAERGFRETPAPEQLALNPDDLLATMAAGLAVGTQLEELGIDLDFAPVLDVDVNPENPAIGALGRSFSPDPQVVAEHGKAFIDMLHEGGALACVKHFPGHGSSATDSHLGLPDVSATWTEAELAPFTGVIRSGRADMVMTAHLFNRHWDPVHPASLSRAVVTDLLRERIGFHGPVVTDDLNMRAVTEHYGLEQAVFLAIDAGSDILLFGNNLVYDPDIVPRAHALILELVESGRISRWRIEQSYKRIMALKQGLPAGEGAP